MKLSNRDIAHLRNALDKQKEPKRAKKRLGKKLFPVKYSSDFINTARSPRAVLGDRRIVIDGKKELVSDAIYDYHRRASAMPLSPIISEDKPVTAPKYDSVDAYIRTWAAKIGRMHGVEVFHQLRINTSCVLYFHGSEYFVEETQLDGTLRISRIYRDKQWLLDQLRLGHVEWV